MRHPDPALRPRACHPLDNSWSVERDRVLRMPSTRSYLQPPDTQDVPVGQHVPSPQHTRPDPAHAYAPPGITQHVSEEATQPLLPQQAVPAAQQPPAQHESPWLQKKLPQQVAPEGMHPVPQARIVTTRRLVRSRGKFVTHECVLLVYARRACFVSTQKRLVWVHAEGSSLALLVREKSRHPAGSQLSRKDQPQWGTRALRSQHAMPQEC